MKGTDIEKDALLPTSASVQAAPQRPSLFRRVVVCGTIYVAYCLVANAFTRYERLTGEHESWALDAFGHSGSRARKGIEGEEAESLYLSTPDAYSALVASKAYATHPHLAGSTEDFEDAKVILELFQSEFGITPSSDVPVFSAGTEDSRSATLGVNKLKGPTAWIDKYYPVMNTPLDRSLEILDSEGKVEWSADLVEDGDSLDPEAAQYRDYVPTFHGLSRDGEVEGQLVYANYGTKEDYDNLLSAGANLTGKIVLARYGGNFRGLKIKGAEELGAAGVLIYSDPRDDGPVTVENGYAPYPYGPARNPSAVQRGSVQFISSYPGDPTTPGEPAYENATRTEGDNIPKIPSLPISWFNAQRLFAEIDDSESARLLTGKPSAKTVKLVNHVDDKVIPIWNTMAAIPGHIKHETVLIGCHRDAWVMGGSDPVSGTVSLHEVIRGFGALLKSGWKPLRNVVFASWDAEEYGLIGSTEWAEDFPEWITENVVAYLNVDVSVSGSRWAASASPSLAHLIRQAAIDVPHPTATGKTLWDAINDEGPYTGPADADFVATYEAAQRQQASETKVYPLGSGSDYTPFLQHLGIASADEGFGGTPSDAPYHYHSIYDSERWMEIYGDPGFHRHVAVAKHLGLTALRVVDSIILPLNTTQYALEIDSYLDRVESIALSLAVSADFSDLRSSIANLQSASAALDVEKAEAEKEFKEILDSFRSRSALKIIDIIRRVRHGSIIEKFIKAAKRVERANAKLATFEQGFISEEGIQEREWYKHLIVHQASGSALTFEQNVTLSEIEAKRVSSLLDKLSASLAA
ncbi:Zn-dependent exopeptidase [Amylocystis lapponica]|nr:Zn-dependent exopeptidase [Amylocystis lapponica]